MQLISINWIRSAKERSNSDTTPFCSDAARGNGDRLFRNGSQADWTAISDPLLHSYGLKLIVKVGISDQIKEMRSPVNPDYRKAIKKGLNEFISICPGIDALFWESELLHPHFCLYEKAEEHTLKELAVIELGLIEEALEGRSTLIFYVPAPSLPVAKIHAQWLSLLCDEAGRRTVIAFSSVAADPTQDHAPLHPYWHA